MGVQRENLAEKNLGPEIVESQEACHALAGSVQSSPNLEMVPGVGVEPTRYRYR